jgi:two-component system chemotaxis response regulator CheY
LSVSLEKVRFLIVDDNVHMLNIVKTILRGFGAVHVFEAKEPQEALFRLRHDSIDILILDYLMGEEDGVAFLRRLRREPDSPAPYVPVIMLTAHSEKARVEAARDAGASEFCAKPVTAAEMLRKVAAVIDHPRPFVRSDHYFGPDRRRRDDPNYPGPERRKDRLAAASAKPPGAADG